MSRILRIVGIIVAVIVVLLLIVVGYVFATSSSKLNATHEYSAVEIEIPDDEEALAEGERIFKSRLCGDCHTADAGGDPEFVNDPAFGVLGSSNLTRGAGGYDYTAEDYIVAIQHGVGHDGRGLIIMPSKDWQVMREAELAPLVAYLLSLEPVDREMPERQAGPILRVMMTFNLFPLLTVDVIDHDNAGLIDLEAEPSVEYGEYLARMCVDCHGTNFAGAEIVAVDYPSANITSHADGIDSWSEEDFITAIRTGVRPDGTNIRPEGMPWPSLSNMTDTELQALYAFLQTTTPVAGN